MLVVDGLSLTINNTSVLTDVSLEIAEATVHALIGPNGAGKTSVVNAISGFVRPRLGRIVVNDQIVGGGAVAAFKAGIGRTFQHAELFDTLTPEEHLLIPRPSTQPSLKLKELAHAIISNLPPVGVDGLRLLEIRRLELARALMGGPQYLLLDEPAAGLDVTERQDMLGMIRAVRQLGLGVLLIEHDMQFVRGISDNLTVLDSGAVVATGTPSELFRNGQVVRAYMGAIDAGT